MEVNISIHKAEKPIAIMRVIGEVNASNYLDVIMKARDLYREDTVHDLILDLSGVTDISTTGLAALHQISLIYAGSEHSIEQDGTEMRPEITHSSSARKHVKLLAPQPEVDQALQEAGFKLFFKVFGDLESAINSFHS
jgi:anti-anti-sigma regulatory factor